MSNFSFWTMVVLTAWLLSSNVLGDDSTTLISKFKRLVGVVTVFAIAAVSARRLFPDFVHRIVTGPDGSFDLTAPSLLACAAVMAIGAIRQIFFFRRTPEDVVQLFADNQRSPYSQLGNADGTVADKGTGSRLSGVRERTVIALWLVRRSTTDLTALCILAFALLSYMFIARQPNEPISNILIVGLAGLSVATAMNKAACVYRVKHGFFGSNEHEARELLRFLIDHADDSDFSGGMGLGDRVPEELKESAVVGVLDGIRGAEA